MKTTDGVTDDYICIIFEDMTAIDCPVYVCIYTELV